MPKHDFSGELPAIIADLNGLRLLMLSASGDTGIEEETSDMFRSSASMLWGPVNRLETINDALYGIGGDS